MDPAPAVSEIAHQIELSVAPVFLLAGVGAFLNVLANRLSRVVDRARELAGAAESLDEAERSLAATELRFLTRRITAANVAIACCTASALLVCLVVATMFMAAPTELAVGRLISWLFIAAMALLVGGLVLFLHEVQLAMRSLRIRFPRSRG
ncbi:MAG: DUF2721 domain-containing protein [Pseudomonadota bacterium]|nr:DUF2721 domain-containing protein [Pseudomonadota bacterium]